MLLGLVPVTMAQAPIIKPGPPGGSVRELGPEEAIEIADTRYAPADVQFLQDMIPHHHQALEMAELVPFGVFWIVQTVERWNTGVETFAY